MIITADQIKEALNCLVGDAPHAHKSGESQCSICGNREALEQSGLMRSLALDILLGRVLGGDPVESLRTTLLICLAVGLRIGVGMQAEQILKGEPHG